MNLFNKIFDLDKRKTTVKTEVIGGITTFLAMAYILFVNPDVLQNAGMDFGAVFSATAIAAGLGTLIMALYANYPIALAPGMGMNAFFAFSVVIGMNIPWETALAGIFCSGILFVILSVTGLREIIINSFPLSLKYAVGTGIGFFIAFIGLKNAGIIVDDQATLVAFTKFDNPTLVPSTLLAIFGLIVTLILYVRKIPGAIFIGMIITSVVGVFINEIELPSAIVASPPSLSPTFGKLFVPLLDKSTYTLQFLIVVLTFLFVDFFDTAGTIIAVGTNAGLTDKRGRIMNGKKALLADSCATVLGSVLGTSSTTSFIESLTGVKSGAKTGLASVVTALLFLLALFFSPLLMVITPAVTAPALIMVGALMVNSFGKIDWEDIAITVPSFITVIVMVLSFSIAEGLASGFIIYTILMIATNRYKQVHIVMYVLSIIFILYFIL